VVAKPPESEVAKPQIRSTFTLSKPASRIQASPAQADRTHNPVDGPLAPGDRASWIAEADALEPQPPQALPPHALRTSGFTSIEASRSGGQSKLLLDQGPKSWALFGQAEVVGVPPPQFAVG